MSRSRTFPVVRRGGLVAALAVALRIAASVSGSTLVGCDDPKPVEKAPVPSASPPRPTFEPPRPEGCARTGSLTALESDPTCVVTEVADDVNRDAMRRVSMEFVPDGPTAFAGNILPIRLTITNTSASEVSLVFDAQPHGTGPKPDWSRLGGVPEPKGPQADSHRLLLLTRTLDAREHNVDGLPSTNVVSGTPKFLRVRLRPNGKLTHVVSWWALGIPAPAAIFRDDAGHRIVPKTAPMPLAPGDYTVALDLPIHGLTPAESTVSTRVHVERVTIQSDQ